MATPPEWDITPQHQLPFDPLLNCLVAVTKLHNKPFSPTALIAGLPLVNHRLTPTLFERAAERADLAANLTKQALAKITPDLLPAILLLHDHQACVLTSLDKHGTAKVIWPETGEGIADVSREELEKKYLGYTIFLKPLYHFDTRANEAMPESPQNWFWSVIHGAWRNYAEVIVASLLINIFALASPLFIMNVYNRVVPNSAIQTLWVLAVGVLIIIGFDFLMRSLRSHFIETTGKKIDIDLSSKNFAQLLNIQTAVRPKSVGSLANSIQAFESFREFLTATTINVLIDLPFVVLFLLVIWLLGGWLVFIPLAAIPVILIVGIAMQKLLVPLVNQSYRHSAEKNAVLIETLANAEIVKGLRAEGTMQRKWETIINAASKLGIKLRNLVNLSSNFALFMQQITVVIMMIAGVYQIIANQLSMGALIACSILVGRALVPITQLAGILTRYHQAKASLVALDTIMKMPTERSSNSHFIHLDQLKGDFQFRTVNFTYLDQPIEALKDLNLHIKAGEHVGIIGRTGCGKTTLLKLLMKFYEPTSGDILVEDLELRQIDPADLRASIGYVPQDTMLFHGNIRENIVISAPYVDDAAILQAAQLSGINTFVMQHPEGFQRQVGEGGQALSNGQRQMISIARALLLDPPVLLFDEPSNSMDDATAAQVIELLIPYLANKTLILATHKANMLALVERLIVIEGGQIVADGPKEEVLASLTEHKITVKD
jgi:ATP-binding cassette subfamily C protein LapB